MKTSLSAIAFNHGLNGASAYTLTLRANEHLPLLVPEWVPGSTRPALVGYIRDRLPAVIPVLARFSVFPPQPCVLEVRTVSAPTEAAGAEGEKKAPHLDPTVVAFSPNGDSAWVALPLRTETLVADGVKRATFRWVWQYRFGPSDGWTEFDTSLQTICIVLSVPSAPWTAVNTGTFNPQKPWADALLLACDWANGAKDPVEAASKLTAALYRLGSRGVLSYDTIAGGPHYCLLGAPLFLLQAFLDRVGGGEGAGPLLNCSDCATIVSTFANLLGADLWQSKMGLVRPMFSVNPILEIGTDSWSRAGTWGGFIFHEVAWSGECAEQDSVYDACLELNANSDPASSNYQPNLPANQTFGNNRAGEYRFQLVTVEDRPFCVPQPSLRLRRSVTWFDIPEDPLLTDEVSRAAKERLTSAKWSAAPRKSDYFFDNFTFFGSEFDDWSLAGGQRYFQRVDAPGTERNASALNVGPALVSWWKSRKDAESRLRVESFEEPSIAHVEQRLLRLITELECPLVRRFDSDVGDVAFAAPGRGLILFARGNHVHVLRSVSKIPFDVTKEAVQLDRWLTQQGSLTASGLVRDPLRLPLPPRCGSAWTRLALTHSSARRDMAEYHIEPADRKIGTVKSFVVTLAQSTANPKDPKNP